MAPMRYYLTKPIGSPGLQAGEHVTVTILNREAFEGQDPLWHPSSWRIVHLSNGKRVKAGVMGGTAEKRAAWLDRWELRVIAKANEAERQSQAKSELSLATT